MGSYDIKIRPSTYYVIKPRERKSAINVFNVIKDWLTARINASSSVFDAKLPGEPPWEPVAFCKSDTTPIDGEKYDAVKELLELTDEEAQDADVVKSLPLAKNDEMDSDDQEAVIALNELEAHDDVVHHIEREANDEDSSQLV